MKTIIEEIESRIAEHQAHIDFYEEKIKALSPLKKVKFDKSGSGYVDEGDNPKISMFRTWRGRSESVIEELESLKKTITFDAIAKNLEPLKEALTEINKTIRNSQPKPNTDER